MFLIFLTIFCIPCWANAAKEEGGMVLFDKNPTRIRDTQLQENHGTISAKGNNGKTLPSASLEQFEKEGNLKSAFQQGWETFGEKAVQPKGLHAHTSAQIQANLSIHKNSQDSLKMTQRFNTNKLVGQIKNEGRFKIQTYDKDTKNQEMKLGIEKEKLLKYWKDKVEKLPSTANKANRRGLIEIMKGCLDHSLSNLKENALKAGVEVMGKKMDELMKLLIDIYEPLDLDSPEIAENDPAEMAKKRLLDEWEVKVEKLPSADKKAIWIEKMKGYLDHSLSNLKGNALKAEVEVMRKKMDELLELLIGIYEDLDLDLLENAESDPAEIAKKHLLDEWKVEVEQLPSREKNIWIEKMKGYLDHSLSNLKGNALKAEVDVMRKQMNKLMESLIVIYENLDLDLLENAENDPAEMAKKHLLDEWKVKVEKLPSADKKAIWIEKMKGYLDHSLSNLKGDALKAEVEVMRKKMDELLELLIGIYEDLDFDLDWP